MHIEKKAQKREKATMSVSLYGNLFFVIIELFMAVITSSQAVLLDAVYDSIEFIMLLPSVFLVPLLYKPSNEKHPFGYMQVESMFVVIKGTTMTAVTIGLIVNNLEIMFHGGRRVDFGTVAYFELFACILGIFMTFFLKGKNKQLNSSLVYMELKSWQIDSIVSLGMTIAFFLPTIVTSQTFAALTPYLDQAITIVLSLFMLPSPVKQVIKGLRDLFLIPPEEETVEEIRNTIDPVLADWGYDKLYYDIVRTGRKLWISVYITFDRDEISISKFKLVQSRCIENLSKKYTDFYLELLPDIEYAKRNPKDESDGT